MYSNCSTSGNFIHLKSAQVILLLRSIHYNDSFFGSFCTLLRELSFILGHLGVIIAPFKKLVLFCKQKTLLHVASPVPRRRVDLDLERYTGKINGNMVGETRFYREMSKRNAPVFLLVPASLASTAIRGQPTYSHQIICPGGEAKSTTHLRQKHLINFETKSCCGVNQWRSDGLFACPQNLSISLTRDLCTISKKQCFFSFSLNRLEFFWEAHFPEELLKSSNHSQWLTIPITSNEAGGQERISLPERYPNQLSDSPSQYIHLLKMAADLLQFLPLAPAKCPIVSNSSGLNVPVLCELSASLHFPVSLLLSFTVQHLKCNINSSNYTSVIWHSLFSCASNKAWPLVSDYHFSSPDSPNALLSRNWQIQEYLKL